MLTNFRRHYQQRKKLSDTTKVFGVPSGTVWKFLCNVFLFAARGDEREEVYSLLLCLIFQTLWAWTHWANFCLFCQKIYHQIHETSAPGDF